MAADNAVGGDTAFVIVGVPDAAVKESCHRVTTALTNAGIKFPMGRRASNLAASDVRFFDQPYGVEIDMAEVKGQESVKRTLEIAEAGGHNALMLYPIDLHA